MNRIEFLFYQAAIDDVSDNNRVIFPCNSRRYIELLKRYYDPKGKHIRAYCKGVAYEINILSL